MGDHDGPQLHLQSRSPPNGPADQSSANRRRASTLQRTTRAGAAVITEDPHDSVLMPSDIVADHADSIPEEVLGSHVNPIFEKVRESLRPLRRDPLIDDSLLNLLVLKVVREAQLSNDSGERLRESLDTELCALLHHADWSDHVADLFHCFT